MVLDSHVHFWKYKKEDYPWIDRNMKILQTNYLPEDLLVTLKRNNVDGCIAVQAVASEVETRFLAELANTHPYIKGVVGWADLAAGDAHKKLTALSQYSAIRGIRHIVQSEPDDYLFGKDFRNGLSLLKNFGYTFDILIYPRQLAAAADLARSYPDQPFIVDHCAKPDIKSKEMENWRKGITDLAMYPNVSCKVSGLLTEAEWKNWSPGDFYPYLDVVFGSFGIGRVMFGSDWPVMLLSGIYVQWKSLLEKYLERYLQEEKEAFFGMNALKVYGLTSVENGE